ncbi:hypothetical protein CDD81_4554 [Ophiocordyceps australis]|uniref:Uncharacterized protein n=1 Tax=Ophiocordyceps australis TaxID=1399860 RepID=A0A2C5XAF1_9HYPO|nr:hypothetical protein CDD81_4554 [Ophiocordyceps australis]
MRQASSIHADTHQELEPVPASLFDLLHNSLILLNTVPHLSISSILNLAATDHAFRALIYHTPGVFRHVNLTRVRRAQLNGCSHDHDETLTEDELYSGPLRNVFAALKHRNWLHHVQTLVLDRLSVTAELCSEIINGASYNVRILSIRDVTNLNHARLQGALYYACRKSRPSGAPRLKALYVFGSSDDDSWWTQRGPIAASSMSEAWVSCMAACQSLIAFDAMLCRGPRHVNASRGGSASPAAATVTLSACASCGTAPETLLHPHSPAVMPLVAPPPLLSSSLGAATMPHAYWSPFTARCNECLRGRYCASCHKWWCEACYAGTRGDATLDSVVDAMCALRLKRQVSKSCWECGDNCESCIGQTQRVCRKCCGGYCTKHNEGSSASHCDWCVSRGRGLGRL